PRASNPDRHAALRCHQDETQSLPRYVKVLELRHTTERCCRCLVESQVRREQLESSQESVLMFGSPVYSQIQKERRVSLEVLVVPFERPCWPQEFVCAS